MNHPPRKHRVGQAAAHEPLSRSLRSRLCLQRVAGHHASVAQHLGLLTIRMRLYLIECDRIQRIATHNRLRPQTHLRWAGSRHWRGLTALVRNSPSAPPALSSQLLRAFACCNDRRLRRSYPMLVYPRFTIAERTNTLPLRDLRGSIGTLSWAHRHRKLPAIAADSRRKRHGRHTDPRKTWREQILKRKFGRRRPLE